MANEYDAVNAAMMEQLKRRLKEREAQDIATAQGRAANMGISGSDYEGVQIGLAKKAATDAETDAMVKIMLDNASRAREERLIAEDRAYQSGEREKERGFMAGENQKGREHQTSERLGGQQFTDQQRRAAEDFADKQRKFQEEYSTLENEKQRAFQAGEADKVRQFEAMQLQMQQAFQAEENELNRIFQGNQQALAFAQEEAAQRRQQRADLLNTGLSGLASVGGNIASGLFGKGAAGAAGAAGSAGAPAAVGVMPMAGAALLGGALTAGSAYLGQKVGSSIFGQNTNGVKVGSLIGGLAGPAFGVGGGIVGGAIGKTVNAVKKIFCFHPETMVMMKDGSSRQITDLELGDETLGGKVLSIRKAMTDKGTMYNYRGVIVTGKHAVKQNGRWVRVENAEGALPLNDGGVVYSIVTDKHRIYINSIEFADEHETDYNELLSIDESLAMLNAGVK